MRRVAAYARCRGATAVGRLRDSPGRVLGQGAFGFVALVAIWHGGSELALLLGELGLEPPVVAGGLVLVHAGLALVASALVLGSTLLDARRADDEEALLVLPIGRLERFAFRGVDLAPALLLTLVLVVPGLRFTTRLHGLGPAGEAALGGALALHAVAASCAALVGLVAWVHWAPRALVRWRGTAAIAAGSLMIVVVIAAGATRGDARAWGPPAWTAELARALAQGDRGLAMRSAASTIALAVLLAVIGEAAHASGVVKGWDRLRARLEGGDPGRAQAPTGTPGNAAVTRAHAVPTAAVPVASPPARQLAALAALEWRAIVRDRALPVLAAGGAAIVGLVAAGIALAGGEHAHLLWTALWLGVGLLGANALAIAALASIAREGHGLGELAWRPVDERMVVDARAAVFGAAAGAWAALWAGAWLGGTDSGLAEVSGAALVAAGMGYAATLVMVAVALGAICGRPGQGLHRGASLVGLATYAMLQALLLGTAVASYVAVVHLGSAGLCALLLAAGIWGGVLSVLRREAVAHLRSARRGSRYHG